MAFGGFTERLALLLTADTAGAVREIKKLGDESEKHLGRAKTASDKWSANLTRGGAAAVGFAGVAGAALFSFAKSAEEANLADVKLQNTLSNMPKLAGETIKPFKDQAAALQLVTVAEDDAIVSAQAMLGTFQLTKQEILGVTPLVVDYARKFDTDLVTAATQVGKALDGQVGALKRNGVSIDEALFKTDRYAAVTQALRDQVGGFAEQEGATFSGQLQILKNQLGEVAEGIGVGVVDAMQDLLGPLTSVSQKFTELDPATQSMIGKFATFGTVALGTGGAISFAAGQALKLSQRFTKDPTVGWSSGLNNWGKAATGAGIAALGLGAALVLIDQKSQKAEARVEDLKDQVKQLDISLGDAAANTFAKWIGESDKAKRGLDRFGLSVAEASAALQGSQPEWDAFLQSLEDQIEATERAEGTTHGSSITMEGFVQQIKRQREAFEGAKKDIEGTNAATQELADTERDATTATDELGTATEETAEEIEFGTGTLNDYIDSLHEADEAQRGYTDALYGTRDAAREQITAQIELNEKLGAYNELSKDGTATQADFALAAFDVQEQIDAVGKAAEAAYETEVKLNKGTFDATTSLVRQKQALIELRDTIAHDSPFRAYLDSLIRDLDDAARPRTGRTDIEVTYTNRGSPGSGSRQVREAGGPVYGGKGEPVDITAHGGEYVLDAGTVDAIKKGGPSKGAARGNGNGAATFGTPATGQVQHVTEHIYVTMDNRVVAEAIRTYVRNNGPGLLSA